jgi:hypothetical protein
MRVLGGWCGALWRTGTGLAAFCLFCPSQNENFVWGFQVAWPLAQLFTTLSFVALALYWYGSQGQPGKEPSVKLLVVSILAALGATYSLANGNLLWPLLVAAALYLRLRVQAILSFATVGAVSIAFYMYHYVRPQTHAIAPLEVLKYCSLYFFSSWAATNRGELFVLRLAILILLLPVLRYVPNFRPLAIQLVSTMLFCLATALVTATGRLKYGVSQAASSRYQTVALLFWCSLGLLWLGGAFLAHPRIRHLFLVAQVCLLAIFARGAIKAKYPIEITQRYAFQQKAATAALLTGVLDPVSLGEVYPEMEVLARTVPYMRANRLSVFSGSFALKLGKPLGSVFPLADPNECSGALESVVPIDNSYGPGLRVLGWAWDRRHQRRPSSIVVTTNGMIVGLGATGKWGPYVHLVNPGLPSRYDGFVAFAPEMPRGSTANFYAILRGSPASACYIGRIVK